MYLKVVWSASSLAGTEGALNVDSYCRGHGAAATEPIPLGFFIEYGRWFQQKAVPDVDSTPVTCLRRRGNGFEMELSDGREVEADRVVVAIGVRHFASRPAFAPGLPPLLARHTGDHVDLARFRGRSVAG